MLSVGAWVSYMLNLDMIGMGTFVMNPTGRSSKKTELSFEQTELAG